MFILFEVKKRIIGTRKIEIISNNFLLNCTKKIIKIKHKKALNEFALSPVRNIAKIIKICIV